MLLPPLPKAPPGLSDSPAIREASLQARGDGAAISPCCPSSPACVALELFQRLKRSDFPGQVKDLQGQAEILLCALPKILTTREMLEQGVTFLLLGTSLPSFNPVCWCFLIPEHRAFLISVLMDGHVPPCSQLLACRWDLVHPLCGLLPRLPLSAESLVTRISLVPPWRVTASHLSAVISAQYVLCNENQNSVGHQRPS